MTVARPSGTATFLFTDVEGSTRRWDVDAGNMSAALVAHDQVMREAFEDADGYVFATGGDGFAVAFSKPDAAVRAAASAQSALELPVRMGVHTGVAEERGGDYFGPTLNRAARLMSAAHGGQVLVSGSTVQLLSDDWNLLDLGRHRLRDLSQPERVWQLNADGLRIDFPPIRSVDHLPGNLPRVLTSFVGRERLVASLLSDVADHQIVTLTGVGGVGKTRVALELAAAVQPQFADGAWFVDLAPVGDPADVVSTAAATFGMTSAPGTPLLERLGDFASGREMLVICDNCEHVSRAAAQLVNVLATASRRNRVVVTSREGVGVPGEQLRLVPSLGASSDEDEAIELFVDRSRAAGVDLGGDTQSLQIVLELCRRLDGVPLAIELAAARSSALSPAEMLERLEQRFRLLTGRRGPAIERHQTLRAAVDWSHDLLSPSEQVTFRRLAPFSGGFTLAAAEQVAGIDDVDELDVIDDVTALVDKSLVMVERAGATTRYRMLESIRQYAAERLGESDESARVRRAHGEWLAGVLPEMCDALAGPDELGAVPEFQVEVDNLRSAVAFAAAAGDGDLTARLVAPLAKPVFRFDATITALGRHAVQVPGVLGHEFASQVAAVAAFDGWLRADRGALAEIAPFLRERSTTTPIAARAAAMCAGIESDGSSAIGLAEAGAELAAARGDRYELVANLGGAGTWKIIFDELEAGRPELEAAHELAQVVGNPSLIAIFAPMLAGTLRHSDPDRAIELLEHASGLVAGGAASIGMMTGFGSLAELKLDRGDVVGAAGAANEGLEACLRGAASFELALVLAVVVQVVAEAGDREDAAVLLGGFDAIYPATAEDENARRQRGNASDAIVGLDGARRTELVRRGRHLARDQIVGLARAALARAARPA